MSSGYAAAAREAKLAQAQALNIDEALIAVLIGDFYAAVRDDGVLGPIFAAHVTDWPAHLARMEAFWASILIEGGRYHGSPMQKHVALPKLDEAHFRHWLQLWDDSVRRIVPHPDAVALLRDRARRIADSLLTAITLHHGGLSALQAGGISHAV